MLSGWLSWMKGLLTAWTADCRVYWLQGLLTAWTSDSRGCWLQGLERIENRKVNNGTENGLKLATPTSFGWTVIQYLIRPGERMPLVRTSQLGWLNCTFGPSIEKEPRLVGAQRTLDAFINYKLDKLIPPQISLRSLCCPAAQCVLPHKLGLW